MIKKSIAAFVAVVALTSFGPVSSARAFVDPISMGVILGATMVSLVVGSENSDQVKEARAKAEQPQKKDHAKQVAQVSAPVRTATQAQ